MKFIKNEALGRPDLKDYKEQKKMAVTLVLDNVRSGLNVGSVFRSCDSFMVERIFLCGITSVPPERDILKSALGATESVEWKYFGTTKEALELLQSEMYRIFAIEQSDSSTALHNFTTDSNSRYALVFGNEVKGVDPELIPVLHGCIEIPQSGTKHSLNISVCAGVVLWRFYEQLVLKIRE